jgi:hypothetical protein
MLSIKDMDLVKWKGHDGKKEPIERRDAYWFSERTKGKIINLSLNVVTIKPQKNVRNLDSPVGIYTLIGLADNI